MLTLSGMQHSAPQTQQPKDGTDLSERDKAIAAYIDGRITVDELLTLLDREGSWVERLMQHMSAHPRPVERLTRRHKRAS